MEYEKEKKKIREHLLKLPKGMGLNLSSLTKLLNVPISKARQIIFKLQLESFLEGLENPTEKYVSRVWRLNESTKCKNGEIENGDK